MHKLPLHLVTARAGLGSPVSCNSRVWTRADRTWSGALMAGQSALCFKNCLVTTRQGFQQPIKLPIKVVDQGEPSLSRVDA